MITLISLVTIHHHAKISQYYLLHSTCCAFHPFDSFIFYLEVYSSYSPSAISFAPHYISSGNHLLSISIVLLFCLFTWFVLLIPFICETTGKLYISVWLILLSKILSNSFVYIYLPHLLYPFFNDGHFSYFHILIFMKKKCYNEHRHSYIS